MSLGHFHIVSHALYLSVIFLQSFLLPAMPYVFRSFSSFFFRIACHALYHINVFGHFLCLNKSRFDFLHLETGETNVFNHWSMDAFLSNV